MKKLIPLLLLVIGLSCSPETSSPSQPTKSGNYYIKSISIIDAYTDEIYTPNDFIKTCYSYNINLPETVTDLLISCVVEDTTASIKVNTTKIPNKGTALVNIENIDLFKIDITAQNGTVKSYTLILNKISSTTTTIPAEDTTTSSSEESTTSIEETTTTIEDITTTIEEVTTVTIENTTTTQLCTTHDTIPISTTTSIGVSGRLKIVFTNWDVGAHVVYLPGDYNGWTLNADSVNGVGELIKDGVITSVNISKGGNVSALEFKISDSNSAWNCWTFEKWTLTGATLDSSNSQINIACNDGDNVTVTLDVKGNTLTVDKK